MDFDYPFTIRGELPSRPEHANTPKSGGGDGRAITTTTATSKNVSHSNSTSNSSSTNGHEFPTLRGASRGKLHDLYVANEAELTKHISTAAGATEMLWGGDQWSIQWYEAAGRSPSSPQGTVNGSESHSLVKHVSIPPSQMKCAVDIMLSRFRTRRLGWVVGPGDNPDQGLLEVVLMHRGMWLEEEQSVMVVDLEKALLLSAGSSIRPTRAIPGDTSSSLFCGSKRGSRLSASIATATTATSTEASSSCHLTSDAQADNGHTTRPSRSRVNPQQFPRLRPQHQEPLQQAKPGLADYQMQLMLLEQQNKKRFIMQQEADQMNFAHQEAQNKKTRDELQFQMTMLQQQNREKVQMRKKIEDLRSRIEESKKRVETRKKLVSLHELEIDPLGGKRETDRTAVRQSQQPPEQPRTASLSGSALDDYNLQLIILEQVGKKRIMMARQAQELQAELAQGRVQGKEDVQKQSQSSLTQPREPQHQYETLDLFPEEGDDDAVLVKREDAEPEHTQQQQRELHESVQTGVGDFDPIERIGGEPGDDINRQSSRPEVLPLLDPATPERKCQVLDGGILLMLLVSPLEVENWVRAWAYKARGEEGEADIAHWAAVYRTLMSKLPPSQFAMYIARDNDKVVGTGYLHLYAGVASVHGITVVPEYRCRRIGSALTRYGMRLARAEGAKIAMLTATAPSINIFHRLGFRDFGKAKLYAWRPHAEEMAAVKQRELKADAEEEGWDWVSSAPEV